MSTAQEMVPGTISSSRPSHRNRSGSRLFEVVIVSPTGRAAGGADADPPRRLLIDGSEPVTIRGNLPAYRVEVGPRHLTRDRAGPAVADLAPVDLDDRADLGAGAAQEDLVGDVQLGTVDRALDDLVPHVGPRDVDEPAARDALEDVVGHGRRDEDTPLDYEQVLGAALADVPIGGQDDGLVESVELRLALCERTVHVGAGDLSARRDGVVIGPAPAADLGPDAALGVDVLAERDAEDGDVGVEVVEANPDRLGALIDDRSQ